QFQAGWNRDDLLRGKTPPLGGKADVKIEDIARMMTLALVDRKLEDEADHAAVSREGTRQLYATSGVLAANVQLPAWIENGAVNLLTKPKGPYSPPTPPGAVPTPASTITLGLIPGYGAPNYFFAKRFRDAVQKKEFNPDPAAVLANVLLDRYFEAARSGIDADPPPVAAGAGELAVTAPAADQCTLPVGPGTPFGPPGFGPAPSPAGPLPAEVIAAQMALTDRLTTKAQATSWALLYYVMKTRPAQLYRFYYDLNKLPRDMRIERAEILQLFAKNFDLLAANGEIDEKAFAGFAGRWLQYMNSVRQTGVDIPLSDFRTDAAADGAAPPMNPFGG
ncbi:MAG: hypothetical protein ACRC7O_12325, partial [Fimbriiglobus sp.]